MKEFKRIRVLVTKIGLDGHDLGARLIAKLLNDAGMEVVYLGKFQSPESIVKAAISEGVDVIGISVLSPNHDILIPQVLELLHRHGGENIKVVVGGIVPEASAAKLKKRGVSRMFDVHATSEEIVSSIKSLASRKATSRSR